MSINKTTPIIISFTLILCMVNAQEEYGKNTYGKETYGKIILNSGTPSTKLQRANYECVNSQNCPKDFMCINHLCVNPFSITLEKNSIFTLQQQKELSFTYTFENKLTSQEKVTITHTLSDIEKGTIVSKKEEILSLQPKKKLSNNVQLIATPKIPENTKLAITVAYKTHTTTLTEVLKLSSVPNKDKPEPLTAFQRTTAKIKESYSDRQRSLLYLTVSLTLIAILTVFFITLRIYHKQNRHH